LANLYRVIRSDPEPLIEMLTKLQNDHKKDKSKTFYQVRDYDKDPNWGNFDLAFKAARTVYLNKTGFNGLFRVNKKGFFNVPLGRTISGKIPDIVQADKIRKLHDFLQTVEIRNLDFDEAVGDAVSGDVIYFDPPYDKPSEDPTEFTMYHKDGFGRDDLVRLKQTCDTLVNRGCNVIVSNNDTEFVRRLFTGYNFIEVETKRSINPESKTRRTGKELIIYKLN